MTIPTTNITESHIADELGLSGSMTGEQIASVMFGDATADVTSENLAGFSAGTLMWDLTTLMSNTGGLGFSIKVDGSASYLSNNGRWFSETLTGGEYQLYWTHSGNSDFTCAQVSEGVWTTITQDVNFGVSYGGTGSQTESNGATLQFREVGGSSAENIVGISININRPY